MDALKFSSDVKEHSRFDEIRKLLDGFTAYVEYRSNELVLRDLPWENLCTLVERISTTVIRISYAKRYFKDRYFVVLQGFNVE